MRTEQEALAEHLTSLQKHLRLAEQPISRKKSLLLVEAHVVPGTNKNDHFFNLDLIWPNG